MGVYTSYSLKVLLLSFYQNSDELFTKERKKMLSRDLLTVSLNYVGRDSNHVQTGLFLL